MNLHLFPGKYQIKIKTTINYAKGVNGHATSSTQLQPQRYKRYLLNLSHRPLGRRVTLLLKVVTEHVCHRLHDARQFIQFQLHSTRVHQVISSLPYLK